MDVCALSLLSEQAEDSPMDTGAHLSCSALSMCREQMVSRVVPPSQCWGARCEHREFFGLAGRDESAVFGLQGHCG